MKNLSVLLGLILQTSCAFAVVSISHSHLGKTYHTKHYGKHAKGFKRSAHGKMHEMKHRSLKESGPLAGSLDLSAIVSLPEDQGNCGSCWDFSLSKALRSQYMLAGMDPGVLEFNYLLNNCGPGPQMNGCNGGDFTAAASFEEGAGPGLNQQDPYTQKDGGKCRGLPTQATAVSSTMLGNPTPTFQDLAIALNSRHMVSIDVAAGSGDWENYSDGIYDGCVGGVDDIDHMIDLVGYSCETSIDALGNCVFDSIGKPIHGDGYLVVENNWNETWGTQAANGHGGYMKTRMYAKDGSHCNAVATDALIFDIGDHPLVSPRPSGSPLPTPVGHCTGLLCDLFGCHLFWCKAISE